MNQVLDQRRRAQVAVAVKAVDMPHAAALDDHRPTVQQRGGVWHINGLYRHGYLCAPALVEDLVHQLLGQ